MSIALTQLSAELQRWQRRLKEWLLGDAFGAAAQEAIALTQMPPQLATTWVSHDKKILQPVKPRESTAMPGTTIAHAVSIALNTHWAAIATNAQALAEKTGYKLNTQPNTVDTSGDENHRLSAPARPAQTQPP